MTTVTVYKAVETSQKDLPKELIGTVVFISLKSGDPVYGIVLAGSTAERLKIYKNDGKIITLDPRLIASVQVTEA